MISKLLEYIWILLGCILSIFVGLALILVFLILVVEHQYTKTIRGKTCQTKNQNSSTK